MKLGRFWNISLLTRARNRFERGHPQCRYVSQWSRLATAFNTKPSNTFRFSRKNTGLFGLDELRDSNGFYLLKSEAMQATDSLVAEACSSKRKRKLVTVFDELSDALCRVADLAEFIRVAHPDNTFASAATDATLGINALVERLNTNQELYNSIRKVVEKGDVVPTDEVDRHVAKLFLFDFEQSAIHLDDDKRRRVVELNDGILQLGSLFTRNITSNRLVPKDSLPNSVSSVFPNQGNEYLITNLYSDYPLEVVRQAAYQVYMYPESIQETRLKDILIGRQYLAVLCGFPTFSHRALNGSLAENPETVQTFLDSLSRHLKPLAQVEFDAMLQMKLKTSPTSESLQMWDVPYLTAALKEEHCDLDSQECSRYFSLGTCMEGLNKLLNSLYGVSLQLIDAENGELWSDDVYKLAVTHETEGLLGYIYMDLFTRAGKPNQDCHFTIQGGREKADGSYQLPVVVLMFNFPSPYGATPCLLSPGMVENLFHEMGHAMHSMLGRTKYQHVTGTRCSTDFAEVPSILMEYFATDPRVIAQFARDYATGEVISDKLLKNLCKSNSIYVASELQLQLFYSALDQCYHGNLKKIGLESDSSTTTTDIMAEVQSKYYNIPHVPQTSWQLRFSHLVGYGARYYSYLMSKSVASWIWQDHFKKDPFSREAGERYRQRVLAHGGGRPPKQILEDFLNDSLTGEKLVQHIVSEVKNRSVVAV
ncbi:hypothetical protein CHUAL_003925 [Chamberlinius hualienensis]